MSFVKQQKDMLFLQHLEGKKNFFNPLGVTSSYKKRAQGPSPAPSTGVAPIWWLGIKQAKTFFPPEMSILLSLSSFLLQFLCPSGTSVLETQHFLFFKLREPS